MPQLLLVDTRVRQFEAIVCAVAPSVTAVTFDWVSDSLEGILDKIRSLPVQSFDNMGIVQDANEFMMQYRLVESQVPADMRDTALTTWEPLLAFFGALKTEFGVKTVDFVSCSLYSAPHFAETMTALEAHLGMDLRASKDRTGNLVAGGNWVQESDGVDIKGLYFTDAIEAYKDVLYWDGDNHMYSFVSVKADGSNRDYAMVTAAKKAIYPNFNTMDVRGSAVIWGGLMATQTLPIDDYIGVAKNESGFALLKKNGVIDNVPGSGYTKIASTSSSFAALNANGTIYTWGNLSYSGGNSAPTGDGFIEIAANKHAFAALKSDGTIYAWGDALGGGSGHPPDGGYVAIASNQYSFVALKSNGSLTMWGSTFWSPINAPTDMVYVAIVGGRNGYAALKSDGSLVSWGDTRWSGAQPPSGNDFTTIIPTNDGYIAMRTDGSLASWGTNGSLPSGSGFTAVSVHGFNKIISIKADGTSFYNQSDFIGTGYDSITANNGSKVVMLRTNGTADVYDESFGKTTRTGLYKSAFSLNSEPHGLLTTNGEIEIINAYGPASAAPSGNNFAFLAGTTMDRFIGVKDERCLLTSITVDGTTVEPGSTSTVYNENPYVSITTADTTDVVTISDVTNLTAGNRTVTITLAQGTYTKNYTFTLIREMQVPAPSVRFDLRKQGSDLHITTIATFSNISSSMLDSLNLTLRTKSIIGSGIPYPLQKLTTNPFIYEGIMVEPLSYISYINTLRVEITSLMLESRIVETYLGINVPNDLPNYTVTSGSSLNTLILTPNIPSLSHQYTQYIKLISPSIQYPERVFSSVAGFSYNEQAGAWIVPPAYGTLTVRDPYAISGVPFRGETTIEIIVEPLPSQNYPVRHIIPITVTLPNIAIYTSVQMEALSINDVKQILLSPDTLLCLSASQVAAITGTVFDSANADITGAERTNMLTYIENAIKSMITAELNSTSSNSNSKAAVDTVLDYYARIVGNTQSPLLIENVNLSRLVAGAPISANAIFCAARTGTVTVTIQYSTLMNKEPYIYIASANDTQITLKQSITGTGELIVGYDSTGSLTINTVVKTVGDMVSNTAIGHLEIVHPNLLKSVIPTLAVPNVTMVPDSRIITWQPIPNADIYMIEESNDDGITWPAVSSLYAGSLGYGGLTYDIPYINEGVAVRVKVAPVVNTLFKPSQTPTLNISPLPPTISAVYTNGQIKFSLSNNTIFFGTIATYKLRLAYNYSNYYYDPLTADVTNVSATYNVNDNSYTFSPLNIPDIISVTPIDIPSYAIRLRLQISTGITIPGSGYLMFGSPRSILFTIPSDGSSIGSTELANLSAASIADYTTGSTPLLSVFTLEQLASLPIQSVSDAAAGSSGSSVRSALNSAISSAVTAAVTAASGTPKADVDAAMKRSAAAAVAGNQNIPAITVTGANMALINSGAPSSVDTVLLSAVAPASNGAGRICDLTTAQLATLAAGGHIYIGGGSSDRVVLRSADDNTKTVDIVFGSNGSIIVDGVSHAVGDSVVTALGTLNLLFGGSLQASFGSGSGPGSAPAAPTVSVSAGIVNNEITITPPTNNGGSSITGYEVVVRQNLYGTSGLEETEPHRFGITFGSTASGFTFNSTTNIGTFAYTGSTAITYTLTDIRVPGREYAVHVRAITAIYNSSYTMEVFTIPALANVSNLASVLPTIPPANLQSLSTTDITHIFNNVNVANAMSLEQLAVLLPTRVGASSAANASTAPAVTNAVATAVASRLSAAPTSSGESKAAVDAALRIAAAAQAATSASATVTATTIPGANLTHLNAAGLIGDAIVASALAPRSGDAAVDCILTPAQETVIAAGGQFYIAGVSGEKLRFVCSGLRYSSFLVLVR